MPAKAAIVALGLSVALFIACLTQVGYYDAAKEFGSAGWELLLFGWLGLLTPMFAWLANPLLFVSWVLLALSNYRAAFKVSIGALLLAMSFLLHSEVYSSGSNLAKIVGYGLGYWLWIASALVLVVGAGVLTFRSSTDARPEPRADELKR